MKTLTNEDVLTLGDYQPTGKIYFVEHTRKIEDFDIQECVAENEVKIIEKCKAIYTAIRATLSVAVIDFNHPEVRAYLQKETDFTLKQIPLTDEQIRFFRPNYDTRYCLKLMQIKKE